ncbi:hypothetical protein, partial [Enterovibrio nigricans]|uniref:hypothetical protein n=1 Tax=Enterovibrio nigricans TaxID=504469 RepID=UPI001BAE7D77
TTRKVTLDCLKLKTLQRILRFRSIGLQTPLSTHCFILKYAEEYFSNSQTNGSQWLAINSGRSILVGFFLHFILRKYK